MLKTYIYSLFILFWALLLIPSNAYITKNFTYENDTNNQAELNNITLPLKRAGNLILVDATIDGQSGTFVFDTGAQGVVLNATYFRESNKFTNANASGITGQNISKQRTSIAELNIGGIKFNKIAADIIDLGHIENSKNVKILGLIGARIIKDFEVTIDIKNLKMVLCRVDKRGDLVTPVTDKNNFHIHHKIQYVNNIIITSIPIGGKKVCFCLDTGAEHNVIDVHNHNKTLETISITSRKILGGASSEKVEVLFGVMNDFSIEGYKFEHMQTLMIDMSNLQGCFGIEIKGMLGFDFFSQGVVRLNIRKKIMSISKY